MTTDPALLSATELLSLYRAKKLSPVEATKAALDRIRKHDGRFNAFCLVDEDGALKSAKASEARWQRGQPQGLADGVTATVKDLLLTQGWPTLRGSKMVSRDQAWDEDAPCVARLREEGAVLLGKTTTPEFGWKGVTDSLLTGVTRNPWNPERTPGGSSGGAAVAAACGMGALNLGTDGGGSIRIPASFTGIFGLKQTYGRVPAHPLSPFGTVAHVGPMTRTVTDAALMLNLLAKPDERDWYALPYDGTDFTKDIDSGVKGLKIAWSPTLGDNRVDPEVAAITAKAARVFADELGATLEETDLQFENVGDVFVKHWFPGAANALRAFTPEQRKQMDPGLVEVAEAGAKFSLMDYLAAVKAREAFGVMMNRFHKRYDLLLTPMMPLPAFQAGVEVPPEDEGGRWTDWSPFSYPFNLTQQPAASAPCGFTKAGLPVGLQIVGARYAESLVLCAARAFERARPFVMPNL
jgi:aspartyl-tRNA(Asn)/glutamyl-tRNA(Gln) amidotransferase subunit A